MIYKLSSYSIYEQGRRKHQEDAIFPAHHKATSDDRLFILCDGTGDEKGDRASNAVCQALSRALLLHSTPEGTFTDAILQQAITSAYNALDAIGDVAGDNVGTTLAVLKFHDKGATIAYIGSSRIYHVRPASRKGAAQLLFRSNGPVEGEPTVMMPRQKVRARVEIAHIQDIQPNDYFFLVSDGMLEFIDDEKVVYNLTKPGVSDKDKVNIFLQATLDNKDNHSGHLIHVTRVKGRLAGASGQSQGGSIVDQLKGLYASVTEQMRFFEGKKLNSKGYLAVGVALLLVVLLLWAIWPSSKNGNADDENGDALVENADSVKTGNTEEEVSVEDFGIDESDTTSSTIDPMDDPVAAAMAASTATGTETQSTGTSTSTRSRTSTGTTSNTTRRTGTGSSTSSSTTRRSSSSSSSSTRRRSSSSSSSRSSSSSSRSSSSRSGSSSSSSSTSSESSGSSATE